MRLKIFSVDPDLCIGCGLCEIRAPENMEVAPGETHARVWKQPESDDEQAACVEASEYCPTGGLQVVGEQRGLLEPGPPAMAAAGCGGG